MLANFFEARVQIADIGQSIDHPFAIELQHQPQRGVRSRMLRSEIQSPQEILRFIVDKFVGFTRLPAGID